MDIHVRNTAGSSLSICIVVVARVSDMRPLLSSKGKSAAIWWRHAWPYKYYKWYDLQDQTLLWLAKINVPDSILFSLRNCFRFVIHSAWLNSTNSVMIESRGVQISREIWYVLNYETSGGCGVTTPKWWSKLVVPESFDSMSVSRISSRATTTLNRQIWHTSGKVLPYMNPNT